MGAKTAMCLFYCSLMTVHQGYVKNATQNLPLTAVSHPQPIAANITSGASVMTQSTPMPTRAFATSPSSIV